MMPRSIIREYQRLELAAGESSLERANAIAHVIMPPMSRGELVAAQALDAVLPRTALVSGARGLVSSPAARNTLAAGVGLTIALGTHTASARPRDGATGQGAATAQAVNFTRLFALRPYKLEEWDAGKSPRDLRMGERFQGSRCSREAAQGGFYLYLGLIQLT
jgi:hypothetical protein